MYQSQNYYQNLGTAGHRATSSVNYLSHYTNYYPETSLPQSNTHLPPNLPPTSSHYLPPNHPLPTSAGVLQPQPVSMMQPTLVGIVPPPPLQIHHPHPISHVPVAMPLQPEQQQATTGGINAVLEYDSPTMSTFLSWCAFGMLKQNRNPTKDFEGLVNSVLFATRLPKSTIIIGLEYMNQRFSHKTIDAMSESNIFVKLITSLILANKFNDDNTFTNRSWCGATGLAIGLLNEEEKVWLQEVSWQLNVVNFESNIVTLEECWKTWLDKYSMKDYTYMNYKQQMYNSSLPPSPVSSDSNYYSSPVSSSPVKYSQESIWSNNVSNSNIWSYSSNYQYTPASSRFVMHQPVPYVGANFMGYSNSYYTFNMASC